MNSMLKLGKELFNKEYISYIEEDFNNLNLKVYTINFSMYIIPYKDKESLLEDIKFLRKIDFVEVEYVLLNLEKVLNISFYKQTGKDTDFMQVVFCSNKDEIVKVFELEELIYELDEPGDIMDDIILRFKILI